jgi:hypothetical protein
MKTIVSGTTHYAGGAARAPSRSAVKEQNAQYNRIVAASTGQKPDDERSKEPYSLSLLEEFRDNLSSDKNDPNDPDTRTADRRTPA